MILYANTNIEEKYNIKPNKVIPGSTYLYCESSSTVGVSGMTHKLHGIG